MKYLTLLPGIFLLTGCAFSPQGVNPVEGFELDRYLGTWFEIARFDHRFEHGLSQVSAIYSRRHDGGIDVINRGKNNMTGAWKEVKGRGYFVGKPTVARLKVSFFWPFYGGYNVIDLDWKNYSYALVCGPTRDYLWILARARQLDEKIIQQLVASAARLEFDTAKLVRVDQ